MVLVLLTTFLASSLAVIGLSQLFNSRRLQVLERLERYAALAPGALEEEKAEAAPTGAGLLQRLLSSWRHFGPVGAYLAFVEKELAKTTILLRPEEFAIGSTCTAAAIFFLLDLLGQPLLLTIVGGLLGFYSWHVLLVRAKRKRLQAFNRQVIDALELIANSLKAGYGFLQAVEMVANESDPPMSLEFRRLLRDTTLGINVETALQDLGRRVESEDMDLVITAILIQRQVGGNLAEVLTKIAHTIRERIKLKNELRTLTAQGRISGLIIMLLPPGVGFLIYLMNRDFINILFVEPVGRMLLFFALVMQVLGYLVIRRIINIEV